ncbi:DNA-binding response regulator mtrA [Sphingobacterium spiritivorum]|uniref:DNA-binding response regulator mtrA n=1 Tax=Sphingobacterium spiritivorum TaxID=258 RepID=A0A380BZD6_SPHSI|nr:DNA-binding response regulator mtrA [Sphingobacterium spiritivorum]
MQKILLAEDDPNLGELLKDYLELKGKFDVTLCQDGEEALVAFHKDQYDLCILDVMMPKKRWIFAWKRYPQNQYYSACDICYCQRNDGG